MQPTFRMKVESTPRPTRGNAGGTTMADMISLQIAQGIWRRQRRRQGTRRCSRLARIYFLRGLSLLCEETLTLLPL